MTEDEYEEEGICPVCGDAKDPWDGVCYECAAEAEAEEDEDL